MFKTTKAKIIFVAIFSLVCIITTPIFVLYKNIEIEEVQETEEQEEIKEKDVETNY